MTKKPSSHTSAPPQGPKEEICGTMQYAQNFKYVQCPSIGRCVRCGSEPIRYCTDEDHLSTIGFEKVSGMYADTDVMLYPYIEPCYWVKPYFDVDCKIDYDSQSDQTRRELKASALIWIREFFGDDCQVSIASNHREIDSKKGVRRWTYSFHLFVQGFRSTMEDLKRLVEHVNRQGDFRFDHKVYRIGKMRFSNQRKHLSDTTDPVIETGDLDDFTVHRVTPSDKLFVFERGPETKEVVKRMRTTRSIEHGIDCKIGWQNLLMYNEVEKILMGLAPEYSRDSDKWLRVMFSVRDLSTDQRMYQVFDRFSARCSDAYDPVNNLRKWSTARKGTITRGTLLGLAKKHEIKYNHAVFRDSESFDEMLGIDCTDFHHRWVSDADICMEPDTVSIIKSFTGSGKTHLFRTKVLKHFPDHKVVSITSRRSMASMLSELTGAESYLVSDQQENGFVCGIDSIERLKIPDEPYIVFLDEVNSLFVHVLQSPCDKTTRNRISYIQKLFELVHNSDYCLMVDADLSYPVVRFIHDNLREAPKIYRNTYTLRGRPPVYLYDAKKQLVNQLYTDIFNDQLFFIGCDSEKDVTKIYHECARRFPDKADRMKLITSSTTCKRSSYDNVTEDWATVWVFTSPSIIYGLSDETQGKKIYGCYTNSGLTMNAKDVCQQLARVRYPESIHIYLGSAAYKPFYTSEQHVMEEHCLLNNKYFKEIKTSTSVKFADSYKRLIYGMKYISDVYRDIKFHTLDVLFRKGFIIQPSKEYVDTIDVPMIDDSVYLFEHKSSSIDLFSRYVKIIGLKTLKKKELEKLKSDSCQIEIENQTDLGKEIIERSKTFYVNNDIAKRSHVDSTVRNTLNNIRLLHSRIYDNEVMPIDDVKETVIDTATKKLQLMNRLHRKLKLRWFNFDAVEVHKEMDDKKVKIPFWNELRIAFRVRKQGVEFTRSDLFAQLMDCYKNMFPTLMKSKIYKLEQKQHRVKLFDPDLVKQHTEAVVKPSEKLEENAFI